MAALTKGRVTSRLDNQVEPNVIPVPVAASTKIFIGSLVAINTSGFAVPASADPSLTVIGVADKAQPDAVKGGVPGTSVDNSSGSNGDLTVNVIRGCFKFDNGDTIAQANVGKPCYASDDQTVNKSSSSNSRPFAGYVVDVDAATDLDSNTGAGVWVSIGQPAPGSNQFLDGLNGAAGANLTDADATIQITQGTWRKLPAATLSAGRNLTLGNTGAKAGDQITITRLDATAQTYTIKDNAAATLFVMPASKVNFVVCQHDGTNWFLKTGGTQ